MSENRSQQNLNQSGVSAITGMSIMRDLMNQQNAKPGIRDEDLKSQITDGMTYGQAFKMMRQGQKKMAKKPPKRAEKQSKGAEKMAEAP